MLFTPLLHGNLNVLLCVTDGVHTVSLRSLSLAVLLTLSPIIVTGFWRQILIIIIRLLKNLQLNSFVETFIKQRICEISFERTGIVR
jgi:hypothetical protein